VHRLVALILAITVVHAADRVASQQPTNLTRTTVLLRGATPLVLGAFAINGDGQNGARGTIQPGVAVWNADSGAMLSDRQINIPPDGNFATATANAPHDDPSLVETGSGGLLALYGAVSTYGPYRPPADWRCPSGPACQPFKFASSTASDARIVDTLAESPEYLLPSVGISEASYATLGQTTIIAGQQQPDSKYGESGTQAYVTFHATSGGGSFDTTAGPWNFQSSHEPPGDGLEALSLAPTDDAYIDFGITQAGTGSGTVALTIGGSNCTMSISGNGSAAAAAAQIASAFQSSCSQLRDRFGATQVSYDPAMVVGGATLAPAVVGITARPGGPAPPGLSAVTLRCSGSISCASPRGPNTVALVRGSGLHRHFLFGGVLQRGSYIFYLMDVEVVTGSWYGKYSNSYGLALLCLRATEPQGPVWTWTDCAGRHPFRLSPGMTPIARFEPGNPYLVPAPRDGYRGNMTPYLSEWTMSAQARMPGAPVIAAVSAVFLQDGNLMLGHGCQTTTKVLTACYAIYDTRTGQTRSAGTIASPPGGSLAAFALRTRSDGTIEAAMLAGIGERWGCGRPGTCFLTYRYDATANRWLPLGTTSLGGSNNAGFPGSLHVSGDNFVLQIYHPTSAGYAVETQVRS
jgi:hypothetical protein